MTIPHKLRHVIKEQGGKYHKIAETLKVNPRYIFEYITKGKEPTDQTEKGREARAKMFLPRYRRAKRSQREPIPEWLKKIKRNIRRLVREHNEQLRRHLP
jgi:hypothetical protein